MLRETKEKIALYAGYIIIMWDDPKKTGQAKILQIITDKTVTQRSTEFYTA